MFVYVTIVVMSATGSTSTNTDVVVCVVGSDCGCGYGCGSAMFSGILAVSLVEFVEGREDCVGDDGVVIGVGSGNV